LTRVCYTTDLHGEPVLYEQLEELLRAETPDLLILGGDFLPDGARDDPLGTQVADLHRTFMPRLERWRTANPRLTIACIGGNHEWSCTRDALQALHDRGRLVLLDHQRPWQYNGLTLLGYACTPATPHWVKDYERLDLPGDPIPTFGGLLWDPVQRRVREADLQAHFGHGPSIADELGQMPAAGQPWILVAHVPPHDTTLDHLYKVKHPVGSRALRAFIEQRQPLCSLHGHVHESPLLTGSYVDWLGATLCINPGQDEHGRLHAVLFDGERPAQTLRHTVFGEFRIANSK
jgi:Icc-related predicted phosphoesterase